MANIPKGLLSGSDPAIVPGDYGPALKIVKEPTPGVVVLQDGTSTRPLAVWYQRGVYTVQTQGLTPATVPYVNAFVRDAGQIDKYWRTGMYRFRPNTGVTVDNTAPGLWTLSGTFSVPASTPVVSPASSSTTARSRATGAAPVAAPTPVVVSAPEPEPEVVIFPVREKRGVKVPSKPKRTLLRAPKGFTIVLGRDGELVIPERTLQTFAAAVGARFEDGLPAHVLVIGPAGTGKTESILALAVSHGMEIAGVIQCGGIEGPADLYGQTVPDETAVHGWRRQPSALWSAFAVARDNPERKYFALLDEVNRVATVSAQNSLLGVLDGTATLANPSTGESIPLPPNLMVGATANIGVAYSGTVRMDAALMSRWWTTVSFSYLPEKVEQMIGESIIGNAEQAKYLARAARELRSSHATDEFRSALIPGTREIVAVAHQSKRDPEGVAGAWHDGVTSRFSNEGRDPSRTEYARVRILAEAIFKAPLTEEREEVEGVEPA